MRVYPTHTLAPDADQLELHLRPAASNFHTAPAPFYVTCCPNCTGLHRSRGEYLECVSARHANR